MTVADNTSRNQYTATSGQTVFAYTFEIVDKSHIVVLKNGTTLSEGTDYTVSNVGNDNGGNVTLTSGATAGDILTLYRDMPYSRTQNYTNSGDFLASEVNADFDDLWLAGEQTNRSFSQSIRKPITDSDSISMELPEAADRANKFVLFDSTGAVGVESLSTGTGPTVIGRQNFTGNGSTTVFTLAADAGNGAAVVIYIDGVYQEQETYTVSSKTLTFTEAPPTNASIEVVTYKITDVGTTNANAVTYTPAGTGAVDTTVQTKLRESVSVKDFGAVGDGVTDDTAAIQAAMDYVVSISARKILFPAGTYNHTGLTLGANDNSEQIIFVGEGGHTSNTKLVCTATSGHGVRIRSRSSGIHAMRIDASSARRSALSPSDNVFELFIAHDDDASSPTSISRTELSDIWVTNGGSHGFGSVWNSEFAQWDLITVQGCKGHAAVFDDGTTVGYTNKLARPFEVKISKLRAFECGGQVLIGSSGQTETPRMILLEQPELLDIAQDKDVTGETNAEDAYMLVIRAPNTKIVMPDCENQRYASSTDEFGNSIPSLTTPVRGIAVRSNNCIIEMPYSSSLSRHGDTTADGTKIILPTSFTGTYGAAALEGWSCNASGALGLYFEGLTSENSGATELLENQSQTNQIFIDTVQHLGINFSVYDWAMPLSPVTRTISGGEVRISESYVSLDGEGDTTDSLTYVRMLSGGATDAGRAGCFVRLVNDNSYDITLNHGGISANGGAMFFKSGANVVLRGVSAGNDQREVVLNYNPTQNSWYEA